MSPSSFVCLTTRPPPRSPTKEAHHASDTERQWLPINFFVFVPWFNNTFPPYSLPLRTLSSTSSPLNSEEERLQSKKSVECASHAFIRTACGINASASKPAPNQPLPPAAPGGQNGTSPPPSGEVRHVQRKLLMLLHGKKKVTLNEKYLRYRSMHTLTELYLLQMFILLGRVWSEINFLHFEFTKRKMQIVLLIPSGIIKIEINCFFFFI